MLILIVMIIIVNLGGGGFCLFDFVSTFFLRKSDLSSGTSMFGYCFALFNHVIAIEFYSYIISL